MEDIVLDPFLDSETTCIAARKLNRKCIGVEVSKQYCEVAKQSVVKEVIVGGERSLKRVR